MPLVLNDRVQETSATTGTGPFSLAGAVSGFQSFSSGVGGNNTTYYAIFNPDAVSSEWEVGLGTLNAGATTLTRTTVYASSNSNLAVNFTAGTKSVFCTLPASKALVYDAAGVLNVVGTLSATGVLFPGGVTQTKAYKLNLVTVPFGIGSELSPERATSFNVSDAAATTNSRIIINPVSNHLGVIMRVRITNPGTGLVNGTYTNVPIYGGSGSSAVCTVVVSGGALSSVTIAEAGTGSGYQYGDSINLLNTDIGGSGSGFAIEISLLSASKDELEMDGINASAVCLTNGVVTIYANAGPGFVAGGYPFAYSLG